MTRPKPLPPGTYTGTVSDVKLQADGVVTLNFVVPGAGVLATHLGKPRKRKKCPKR